jgi:hypothetical protein
MAIKRQGTIPFRGYRTWYQIVGDVPAPSGKVPLLVLRGGPGFPHDYLEDLERLPESGRPIVLYDQLPPSASWILKACTRQLRQNWPHGLGSPLTLRTHMFISPRHLASSS